jgi:hypothetical protein
MPGNENFCGAAVSAAMQALVPAPQIIDKLIRPNRALLSMDCAKPLSLSRWPTPLAQVVPPPTLASVSKTSAPLSLTRLCPFTGHPCPPGELLPASPSIINPDSPPHGPRCEPCCSTPQLSQAPDEILCRTVNRRVHGDFGGRRGYASCPAFHQFPQAAKTVRASRTARTSWTRMI